MTEPGDTVDQPRGTDPHEQETVPPSEPAGELAGILDRYMADLQAGNAPDRGQLLAAHPALATQLEACLAGIEFINRATGAAGAEPTVLGDFRIIREIGRGGMGVVYEAEQTSLHRRVALKVLRFGVADEEATQRFRREAETVARLHHTNIVPIFAVGSERGVHYYAMQLIDGRSLADVQDEAQRTSKPLRHEDVTRWGLQAAEALAHAHHRGVIHRDIKPSNLLIDNDGVVWLTDFGLAKHADEVTLTASGALMGTPRYMSPEQAESMRHTIDHRTDLYSLGASLYELATGRPVFESSTAHLVIVQILTEEPARPRQVCPSLPRDLETIILTCLNKDPAHRFQSAQALADDLRAVLENRPIQARRVPLVERMIRYVGKRRKAIKNTAIATAATVLLLVGALLSWRYYTEWRLGRIVLSTDGPPLSAQVLSESGDSTVGEPFDVGTDTVVSLPAGEYQLHLNHTGFMSQLYRVGVDRGETRTHGVSLGENRLAGTEPIPFSFATEALVLSPGKADFVEWDGQTLIRRDGLTGKPVWDTSHLAKPWAEKRDPASWMRRLSHFGDEKRPGKLLEPAADLNGDGTNDLVWAIYGTPSFLAVSGKDGSMLWTFSADPDGPGGPDPNGPAMPKPGEPVPFLGHVLGEPAAGDLDGDGTADIVAMFAILDDPKGIVTRRGNPTGAGAINAYTSLPPGRRIMTAVSGRSGKSLWNHPLDPRSISLARERWSDAGPTVVRDRAGSTVVVVDGTYWIGLDGATGRPRGRPINLGFEPARPLQYADLDGDGTQEILALGLIKLSRTVEESLAAFSTATGARLWLEPVQAGYNPQDASLPAEWPAVADLDGDGRAEVVVPYWGPRWPGEDQGGVRMFDGPTGQTRWVRPLWASAMTPTAIAHLVEGPDLDLDGTRDLVAISRFEGRGPIIRNAHGSRAEPAQVLVDALSGKDGVPLWSWRLEIKGNSSPLLGPPRWWGRGPDGWPFLAISIGGNLKPAITQVIPQNLPDPAVVHILSSSSGQESHTVPGLSWPRVADLDGDGLDDLWGEVGGKLAALRGEIPETWRALGEYQPTGDLDGDGLDDVVSVTWSPAAGPATSKTESEFAVARSGRDGRLLWQERISPPQSVASRFDVLSNPPEPGATRPADQPIGSKYILGSRPLPEGDLDGDGTPDIVVTTAGWALWGSPPTALSDDLPIQLLSGRTGRHIWSTHGLANIYGFDLWSVARNEPPDVFMLHLLPKTDTSAAPSQGPTHKLACLARISGRDGHAIWEITLAEVRTFVANEFVAYPHQVGDLDGDGGLDVIIAVAMTPRSATTSFELRAVSLRDGKSLWTRAVQFKDFGYSAFLVGDLDGDARAEVVLKDLPPQGVGANMEVIALEGRDGSPRWTWRGGDAWDHSTPGQLPFCLVDLDGNGHHSVCLNAGTSTGSRRLVILDAQGKERAGRDLAFPSFPTVAGIRAGRDGRDQMLTWENGRLRASAADLTERWSWPCLGENRDLLPLPSGRPVVVIKNPLVGLDAATGQPIWSGGFSRALLEHAGAASFPRVLNGPVGTTVCQTALPTSEAGRYSAARGERAQPALTFDRDDPRWRRRLPWLGEGNTVLRLVELGLLALINIVTPLAILRLATRKRVWSVRFLLALPIVAAIPLTTFLVTIKSTHLSLDDPATWAAIVPLASAALGGMPVLAYIVLIGQCFDRRRWRAARLAGLTAGASLVIATVWLWSDMKAMTALERYTGAGWYQIALPGAYAVGCLALLGWVLKGAWRFVKKLGHRTAQRS